jgi:hypothetical protein
MGAFLSGMTVTLTLNFIFTPNLLTIYDGTDCYMFLFVILLDSGFGQVLQILN